MNYLHVQMRMMHGPGADLAPVLLTASFEKMRLTCDVTVSGEISRVRAMRLLAKP